MAKKRRKPSLAEYSKKVAARKKKRAPNPAKKQNAALVGNPWTGLAELILPGLGGYAATRLGGRIAYSATKSKLPNFCRHAGPIGSVLTAAGLFFGSQRFETLEPYHEQIVVGAAIGAVQTVAQTYMPQYAWILDDFHVDAAKAKNGANGNGELPDPEAETGQLPNGNGSASTDDFDISDIVGDDYAGSLQGGLLG